MSQLDFIVLFGYFTLLIVIGILCSFAIRKQEDYFLGGRAFGKLLQTFAAFGAGTGSQDPINLGRTTWTSGLSGIWAALCWLFVTPFYWIFAVWYRRMRLLTLGDWFVERYQSRAMGVAYTLFGFTFMILYLSVMFSAISKVIEPLIGADTTLFLVSLIGSDDPADLKFVVVPTIAVVVLVYGILGGLAAAYWTDLLQGLGIIALSVILIPTGLQGLVDKYGDQYPELTENGRELEMMDGFTIMHSRLTDDYFQLFDTPQSGEFPLHYIVALVFMSLIGIVIQPHFIATGGGSAKTELSARVGLVSGNFLKRLCTVGWGLTGLIALALLAGSQEIAADPDRVWGVASREILQPLQLGLVGLMVACLLAALMSSADTYMLVSSALLVRNVYAAYIEPNASERTYLMIGRVAGLVIIAGSAMVAVSAYDVLKQYLLALEVAASFAAPFWLGLYWRRASRWAAWATIAFAVSVFFIAPMLIPLVMPELRTQREFLVTNDLVTTVTRRPATPVDVERREAKIEIWDQQAANRDEALEAYRGVLAERFPQPLPPEQMAVALAEDAYLAQLQQQAMSAAQTMKALGTRPEPVTLGEPFEHVFVSGGTPIFWSEGLVDRETGQPATATATLSSEMVGEDQQVTRKTLTGELAGRGRFNVEFLPYYLLGIDFSQVDAATLNTLRLPVKILTPFLVMIALSLVTPRDKRAALDRYYAKMRTPVDPDPVRDQANLEAAYLDPTRGAERKLFPHSNWEILKPRPIDVIGFLVSLAICFLFIQLILWVANLGA